MMAQTSAVSQALGRKDGTRCLCGATQMWSRSRACNALTALCSCFRDSAIFVRLIKQQWRDSLLLRRRRSNRRRVCAIVCAVVSAASSSTTIGIMNCIVSERLFRIPQNDASGRLSEQFVRLVKALSSTRSLFRIDSREFAKPLQQHVRLGATAFDGREHGGEFVRCHTGSIAPP